MSLYHEAAQILGTVSQNGESIKSLVFGAGKKKGKSDPKTLYALSIEAAKWSPVLKEVLEGSGVLGVEKGVCRSLYPLIPKNLVYVLFCFLQEDEVVDKKFSSLLQHWLLFSFMTCS
jgi:25S rRNA (cytosine2278-C5)-methyltransferase